MLSLYDLEAPTTLMTTVEGIYELVRALANKTPVTGTVAMFTDVLESGTVCYPLPNTDPVRQLEVTFIGYDTAGCLIFFDSAEGPGSVPFGYMELYTTNMVAHL